MKSLSLSLLGLALNYIPAISAKCFSESLKPSYPCCKGNKVVYTDKDGQWGVENGEWCGIETSISCFSLALGYPCCKGNTVVFSDDRGDWGVEDKKWCGIGEAPDACFSVALGYPCCEGCKVKYTDKSGDWGVEHKQWCGIKDSCTKNDNPSEEKEEEKEKETDVEEPVQEITDFEYKFLKLENKKKNMLYSPLSIDYALNMLKEGAANNTLAEIIKVIGNKDLTKYSSVDKNLSFANGLFIRDNFYEKVLTSYIDTLKEKYDAEIVKDEFKDAQNANQWIEDKTLGIIKDMLDDSLVQNPLSKMLIINALAIDMEWAVKFRCSSTYGGAFFKDDGEKIKATMMSRERLFSNEIAYYLDDDLTVLTMNLKKYGDVQLEFMALMPKTADLSSFVDAVTKAQIEAIDEKLTLSSEEKYGVNIEIPKFKFDYDLELKKDLIELGINDAFDGDRANFSKMSKAETPDDTLYVSDALHKADIEFTEDGVKAAAVTVIAMMANSAIMPQVNYPVEIIIDKPFMFVIRDKTTKDVWFTGTVYEPNLWENDRESYYPSQRNY